MFMPIRHSAIASSIVGVIAILAFTSSGLAQQPCNRPESEAVRVSEDSIGPLPLFVSIANLAAACNDGVDTVFVGPSGRRFPAKVYHFSDVSALAVQYRGTALDEGRAADGWIIIGGNAVLPSNVAITSPWSMLSLIYGSAQANNRNMLVVRFCRLPRILFTMELDRGALERLNEPIDLATIPPSATIHHLLILSPELGRAFAPC